VAVNRRLMRGVSPTDVFDALRDGQTYGHWVVGTRGVREVSSAWPQPGTEIHYVVGYGPARKDDRTASVFYEPDRKLALEAKVWPVGTLSIVLTVQPTADGCEVVIEETAKRGILKTLHNPLFDLAIKARNVETLRRLEQDARTKKAQAA
jgi:hypothetical protein